MHILFFDINDIITFIYVYKLYVYYYEFIDNSYLFILYYQQLLLYTCNSLETFKVIHFSNYRKETQHVLLWEVSKHWHIVYIYIHIYIYIYNILI